MYLKRVFAGICLRGPDHPSAPGLYRKNRTLTKDPAPGVKGRLVLLNPCIFWYNFS